MRIREEFESFMTPLTDEEYSQLEASLLAEGCRDALVVWNDTLLDGHHRYKICRKHGLPFNTAELDLPDETAAKDWTIRHQLGRRNLSKYQRGKLVLALEPGLKMKGKQYQGARTDICQNSDKSEKADTNRELANLAGMSRDTIAKIKYLERHADEAAKEKLTRGDLSIHRAHAVAKAKQREITRGPTPPLPEGKFDLIYADPPWQMSAPGGRGAPENHYQTMPVEDICGIQVPAADDAILFLWAVPSRFEDALQVMKSWGFKYKTHGVWDKVKMGIGYWFRMQHENLLIGLRGSVHPPVEGKRVRSVIREPRTEHSRKPERAYEMIEQMFPGRKYLELFSRSRREGWTMWGLEAPGCPLGQTTNNAGGSKDANG